MWHRQPNIEFPIKTIGGGCLIEYVYIVTISVRPLRTNFLPHLVDFIVPGKKYKGAAPNIYRIAKPVNS
jgi:hypothetical protein